LSESNAHNRPIISAVISPSRDADRQSFQRALSDLAEQDPTIRIRTGSINGQTILSGMSELHLEAMCDRIVQEYKVQLNIH